MPPTKGPPSRRDVLRERIRKVDQEEKRLNAITPADAETAARKERLQRKIAERKKALQDELKLRDEYHESTKESQAAAHDRKEAARQAREADRRHDHLKRDLYKHYKKRPLSVSDLSPKDRQRYLASKQDRDAKKARRQALIDQEKARRARREQIKRDYRQLRQKNPNLYKNGEVANPCVKCVHDAVSKFAETNARRKAAADVFPGQQNYGNCGVQSASQIIQQADKDHKKIGETALLDEAVKDGNADAGEPGKPDTRGGTNAEQRKKILAKHGVPSTVKDTTKANLADAIKNKRGVIVNVDVKELWKPTTQSGGHAIVVTDGEFDKDGNLTAVYINDTGQGKKNRKVPIDDFMDAADAKKGGSQMNVTDKPIWP